MLAACPAVAGTIPVPADASVGLTAEPTVGLMSGQPITFTMSATNHGPQPIGTLGMLSSRFTNELDISSASSDCQGLALMIVDGKDFFYYSYYWSATYEAPIAVGETRTCHLTLPLGAGAPAAWTFGFEIPNLFVDLDPSNNSAFVTLHRGVVQPKVVPALSPLLLSLLAGLLALTGGVAQWLRRSRVLPRFHRRFAKV